jgi:protein kinase-like protein
MASPPLAPPAPVERILGGKYRVVRQLESGGMSSLWLAEHLDLGAPVAVKLISPAVAATPDGAQRFLREARTAASLRSAHVVQIFDFGVEDGTPYIVMELLQGESLASRLSRVQRLGLAETRLVIRHMARAVGRAHELGIIHRDLKPGNVFIVANDDEAVVKLLDFGIAKTTADPLTASIASHTLTGEFLGTPLYVSPEQAEGVRTIDHRTDIWSMGVIAFECLIGHPPFWGDTFGSLLLAICSRPLPVPSEHGAVPHGFDSWFARACARERSERFQSAREASEALKHALAHEPLTSAPVAGAVAPAAVARLFARVGAKPVEPSAPRRMGELPDASEALDVATAPPSSAVISRRRAPPARRDALLFGSFVLGALGLLLWVRGCGQGDEEGDDAVAQTALEPASPLGPRRAPDVTPPAATPPSSAGGSSSVSPSLGSQPDGPAHRSTPDAAALARARAPQAVQAPPVASVKPSVASIKPSAATQNAGTNARSSPASGAGVDCRQPFWIDEGGIRRLKMACLGQGNGAQGAAPERANEAQRPAPTEVAQAPVGPASNAVNEAAATALASAAGLASSCRPPGGPTGDGKLRVIYSNDGDVQSVEILTGKFRETLTGSCIRMVFRRAKIAPFQGEPPTFIKSFTIPSG